MKLELKHLAAYLPYRLKMHCGDGRIEVLSTLTQYTLNIEGRGTTYGMFADIDEVKPILRPMSEFMSLQDGTIFFSPYTISTLDMDGGIEANITSIPYQDFNWLVSEHFDVHNLIPAGLAIDINTLDNA